MKWRADPESLKPRHYVIKHDGFARRKGRAV
jgi:hypothetical protein